MFGSPEETIVCFGDYEQKRHMKFKEPIIEDIPLVKDRCIRTLFRKKGYKTYLVDEFRTSGKCSKCEGGDCKKFLVLENPKPYKKNLNLVLGLITCKKCSNAWNRDCNGATNIYKIVKGYIEIKKDRTIYVEAIYKLY